MTDEMKHSPLPWRIEFIPEDHGYINFVDSNGNSIFEVPGNLTNKGPEWFDANIVQRVNQGPKVDKLLGIAKELAHRVVEENGGKLLGEEYWDDTVDMASEFLKANSE